MKWKSTLFIALALIVGLGVLVAIAARSPAPPAHRIYFGGTVLLMDQANTVAQALSTRGALIDSVGSTEDILALATDDTELVNLHGRTVLPGFIDAHGHFPGSGLRVLSADLNSPPIGDKQTMEEVLAAMSERALATAPGEWVTGFGYDDTLLKEKRHPTRAELDAISTQHPIAVLHVSGHMLVANSVALAIVGVDASTPDPSGGVIGRRDGSMEPNGLLQENARMAVLEHMQGMGIVDAYRLFKSAANEYSSVGVTTAQSGGVVPELTAGLYWFSRLGVVPQRLVLLPFETAYGERLLNGDYDPASYTSDKVFMGPVKLVADGSIQGYTGYLSEPYFTPYHGDSDYRGYPSIERDELFEKVEALHKAGYQLAIHGNGDASIDDILDAFEAAQAAFPREDPRMILIHGQMARKDQIARMGALGVTPSYFTAHTWYWGDRHRDIFMGPVRAQNISPSRWTQEYGLRFSSHLDTPVTPMRPLQAVWSMMYRQTVGGDVLGQDQRIDLMSALRAVTIDAAWQVFQEGNRGSLEPGKLADLVVLSGDLLNDPYNMRELQVDLTVIGGVTVYERH